jgi:Protein of unknown function (DUF2934)
MQVAEHLAKEGPPMSHHDSHHHVRPPEPIVTLTTEGLHKVSVEDIAKRAYEKFEARGRRHGDDQEDWMAAERELNGEAAGNA